MKSMDMLFQGKLAIWLLFLGSLALKAPDVYADRVVSIKTLNDVYKEVMVVKSYVELIRESYNVKEEWPKVPAQHNKSPRHVLQKGIEVLEKINRLRIIKRFGRITIPPYPLRDITPAEVYELIERLLDEARLVLEMIFNGGGVGQVGLEKYEGKTPNDVYRELWNISYALDPAIGIRGFNPNDVYAQAVRLVSEVNYLRLTQNLPLDIAKPSIIIGKHPNHALAAVYDFLKKIAQSELNLGMEPINTFEVPRRVIRPPEVYDALQVALAELQRIKYRIGFERHFISPPIPIEYNKTPDDVIQNINWAAKLMPDFVLDDDFVQGDQEKLYKTINHVYSVTAHIFNELDQYRMVLGVQPLFNDNPASDEIRPKRVYQIILECLETVNTLRSQKGLGVMVVPGFPLTQITTDNLYDLVMRFGDELEIVYAESGIVEIYDFETLLPFIEIYNDKTLRDVYTNIRQISYMLDFVLKEGK